MTSSTSADSAARLYACPVCAREFNKKANLKVHSRKHTGEKPYACSRSGCNRRFMWKSSVSFHEQNCVSSRRDSETDVQSVPKRHKVIHNSSSYRNDGRIPATPITPGESPPRTHVTNVLNPAIIPVHSSALPNASLPNSAFPSPHDFNHRSGDIGRHTSQASATRGQSPGFPQSLARPPLGQSLAQYPSSSMAQLVGSQFTMSGIPGSAITEGTGRNAPLMRNFSQGTSQHMPQYQGSQPLQSSLQVGGPFPGQPGHSGQPKQVNLAFASESQPLPAPSTILDKHMPTAGRPPVIPASMPKHFYAPKPPLTSVDPISSAQKNVFDNKLPSTLSSAAKPPVMHGPKMFKMPISMDLDDSDDEGAERIMGAQDHFMRTGNIFAGFAPPTRCSPLPASSPIVCPGLSPMPLSPLAPFSPLPPDSPAHNAPNPVHPPLNQPQRSLNSNY